MQAAIDTIYIFRQSCVPMKRFLWTLKFEFHIIFKSLKMILLLSCFLQFKNVKTIIISSQAVQKQGMGQIWPMSHCLLTPKLAQLESIILVSFCLRLEEMRMNGSLPFQRDLYPNIFIKKKMLCLRSDASP